MNPTAEDILNKIIFSNTGLKDYEEAYIWMLFNPSPSKHIIFSAMEEYSLLKSKEAADKAWEVGVSDGIIGLSELWNDDRFKVAKETFMKELFKPGK